jgi:hypothetical protein
MKAMSLGQKQKHQSLMVFLIEHVKIMLVFHYYKNTLILHFLLYHLNLYFLTLMDNSYLLYHCYC